jgi:hypothetical protein
MADRCKTHRARACVKCEESTRTRSLLAVTAAQWIHYRLDSRLSSPFPTGDLPLTTYFLESLRDDVDNLLTLLHTDGGAA